MQSKLIISCLFVASICLAVFHDLAIRLSWYYLYPMIDIPMHILGGFVVGLFVYIISTTAMQSTSRPPQSRWQLMFVMVFGTFLVSLVWEAFELVFYLTKDAGLSYETLSDIVFGVVGAVVAWVLVWLLPTSNKKPHQTVREESQ